MTPINGISHGFKPVRVRLRRHYVSTQTVPQPLKYSVLRLILDQVPLNNNELSTSIMAK